MEQSVQELQATFRKQFQSASLTFEQKTLSHFARVEAHKVAAEEKKWGFWVVGSHSHEMLDVLTSCRITCA